MTIATTTVIAIKPSTAASAAVTGAETLILINRQKGNLANLQHYYADSTIARVVVVIVVTPVTTTKQTTLMGGLGEQINNLQLLL